MADMKQTGPAIVRETLTVYINGTGKVKWPAGVRIPVVGEEIRTIDSNMGIVKSVVWTYDGFDGTVAVQIRCDPYRGNPA